MILREYLHEQDFEKIKNWVTEERAHAMWCANLFAYPLNKENVAEVLSSAAEKFGDVAYIAALEDDKEAGFFCFSVNQETNEAMLKFVVVNPEYRGKGIAAQMLDLIVKKAFEEKHADAVQLNVFPENPRAKKCYQKAGFTERKTTENAFAYKEESWGRCNMVLYKDCRIDRAQPEDDEKIGQFINEAFTDYAVMSNVDLNFEEYCFVAKNAAGEIIGAITGRAYYNEVHIGDLIIDKNNRRKNIGSKLVRAVEEGYKGKGYRKITLTTFGFQAPDFYKKLGYSLEFVRKDEDPKLCKYFYCKMI